jgi:hypothetical protein
MEYKFRFKYSIVISGGFKPPAYIWGKKLNSYLYHYFIRAQFSVKLAGAAILLEPTLSQRISFI